MRVLSLVRELIWTLLPGFFPGLSFCLTFWYRPEERSVRIAFIYASAALASAFGGLVAFGVAHMDGVGGLVAWRSVSFDSFLFVKVLIVILGGYSYSKVSHPCFSRW